MSDATLACDRYLRSLADTPWAAAARRAPWRVVAELPAAIERLRAQLPAAEWRFDGDVAVHRSATVEPGATLKGPLVIGARCFVAAGAYLRGGVWLEPGCTLGPGVELKTTLALAGTAFAHFNFVGDSIVGAGVNFEAGSIVCNHRNERADKAIFVRLGGNLVATGATKFGALIGDGARIGANAVLAPGCLLEPGAVVARGRVLDPEN